MAFDDLLWQIERGEEIVEVRRLALKPGDVIIIRAPQSLNAEQCAHIRRLVQAEFSGHKVLLLGGGIELSVVEPEKEK